MSQSVKISVLNSCNGALLYRDGQFPEKLALEKTNLQTIKQSLFFNRQQRDSKFVCINSI